jgi:hypothetical protein
LSSALVFSSPGQWHRRSQVTALDNHYYHLAVSFSSLPLDSFQNLFFIFPLTTIPIDIIMLVPILRMMTFNPHPNHQSLWNAPCFLFDRFKSIAVADTIAHLLSDLLILFLIACGHDPVIHGGS